MSTNLTLFWRLYAIVWISFFPLYGFYWVFNLLSSSEREFDVGKLILFILFGLVSSIFVYFMAGTLKNVFLDGKVVVISNFWKQIRVPLSEISHVDNPDWSSLRRIKIIFRQPSNFGREIVFSPPMFEAKETAELLKSRSASSTQGDAS